MKCTVRMLMSLVAAISAGACTPQENYDAEIIDANRDIDSKPDSGPGSDAFVIDTGPSELCDPPCEQNQVCFLNTCVFGECVSRQDCPRPAQQLCQSHQCVPDPNSPIGSQCPDGDVDCDGDEFCYAGTCYANTTPSCTNTSDCNPGMRCDPVHLRCVSDVGGCQLADTYAELACVDDERCNEVSGYCSIPAVSCSPACRPDQICVDGRCVNCNANDECDSPGRYCCSSGYMCNTQAGFCDYEDFFCQSDADCGDCRVRVLINSTTCIDGMPCEDDSECAYMAVYRCQLSSGQCRDDL